MSERVSRKVRELDTAQSRINNTLQSIDCVVKRTNAVDGIQQALQSQDYEAAAGYIDTLLESEESYGKAHNGYSVQPNEQQSMVSACLVTDVVPDMDHGDTALYAEINAICLMASAGFSRSAQATQDCGTETGSRSY